MARIAIVHFNPIELYPPATNFLRFVQSYYNGIGADVYTTSSEASIQEVGTDARNIRTYHIISGLENKGAVRRIFKYFVFFGTVFTRFLFSRPSTVLYYETISSFPVYLYKRYVNRKARILIHYHEYTSPGEYESGMKLVRYFHKKEKWLYPHAIHISQTNEDRKNKFLSDESLPGEKVSVLPNYPSAKWQVEKKRKPPDVYKLVYVGALDMDTMYVTEFANWIISMNGKVLWDIYSWNISTEVKNFIASLGEEFVRFKGRASYRDLPSLLSVYDIGVILYKGHIPNYIYNAPNKLFEYLSAGLDVWYPNVMLGCKPYQTYNVYPKVLELNFDTLPKLDFEELVDLKGHSYKSSGYNYENIFPALAKKLIEDV